MYQIYVLLHQCTKYPFSFRGGHPSLPEANVVKDADNVFRIYGERTEAVARKSTRAVPFPMLTNFLEVALCDYPLVAVGKLYQHVVQGKFADKEILTEVTFGHSPITHQGFRQA